MQIFIDSDRKKAELLYGIYCCSIAYFILAQKCPVPGQKFAEVYNFIL